MGPRDGPHAEQQVATDVCTPRTDVCRSNPDPVRRTVDAWGDPLWCELRGKSDPTIPPARSDVCAFPEYPYLIPVADTIDRIRIYPNLHKSAGTRPFRFPITKLEVLVPAVPEVRGSIGVPLDESTRRR